VSSELERLLREARDVLPDPDDAATARARETAVNATRGRRSRARAVALIGVTLVVAIGLGVGVGSLVAPSGTAAREPSGLGFVPEPGWFALQSPPAAVQGQPAVAVASNVPFAPDDVADGLVDPSGLPYSTLLTLPPRGVVIVGVMANVNDQPHLAGLFPDYKEAELPLRLRNAVPYIQWGAQVRPDEPLAHYQLRARIGDYNVDLTFYFGTPTPSSRLLAEAQRQLDGLVVASTKPRDHEAASLQARDVTASAPAVIDRTVLCSTAVLGGIYGVEARVYSGIREGATGWRQLPFAAVSTGGSAGVRNTPELLDNSLAWITAGKPSSSTTLDSGWGASPVRSSGTLALRTTGCTKTTARVPLTARGLRGGAAGPFGEEVDCLTPRRVLVRIRATLESSARLQHARGFLRAQVAVRTAQLAVLAQGGRHLVYADVAASGKARLFTARGCTRE
jgi:hypothetical protein